MGISMVGVEEGREFRFRGDLYSQESIFPLVKTSLVRYRSINVCVMTKIVVLRFHDFGI